MPNTKDENGLTHKQKLFCDEYIANGFHPKEAYLKVYGEKPNNNSRITYPYDLLRFPQVKEYIQKKRQEVYDNLHIDAIRIAEELADIAFAEKEDEIYTPNFKLKALEILSKNLGLQAPKVEQNNTIEVTLGD